jgi:GTP-binding protein
MYHAFRVIEGSASMRDAGSLPASNRLLRSIIERQPPPYHGNRQFKLLYATQLAAADPRPFEPPEFLLFVNDPQLLRKSYLTFLRSRLRERLDFPGLPILLSQRGRKKLS